MRGGAMRSILIIGTLTLVGIAGLWFLFGDSTEVFELLYSNCQATASPILSKCAQVAIPMTGEVAPRLEVLNSQALAM